MNVAFIPVRGGSKSIPLKNIKEINGKPLVYWTTQASAKCKYIDLVYIATDSEEIKKVVESFALENVRVIGRSEETASDTASTESALIEFAKSYDFENVVLVQATSPLLETTDLERGFKLFFSPGTDSVLSVVEQKRFHWMVDANQNGMPTNYNVFNRPRRQDFEGYYVENGAFYITSKERLIQSSNRVSGNIKLVKMDESTFYEIDEPGDWFVVEALMKCKHNKLQDSNAVWEKRKNIRMFLTDCDGCLTDGGMYYTERGDELKKFNTRDGKGFELLRRQGILTGIITSEDVQLVYNRAQKLKLDIIKCGVNDKLKVIKALATEYHLTLDQIIYIGDDINDLEVIRNVGIGCSVSDAMPEVKRAAAYVTCACGGQGAIREVAEILIQE